jgi:hypothetical protein
MYSRPTAQFIMWRRISIVRLIDAGARMRGVLRRPAMLGFLKSAMKSSTSAVRISARDRSPKYYDWVSVSFSFSAQKWRAIAPLACRRR